MGGVINFRAHEMSLSALGRWSHAKAAESFDSAGSTV